MDCILILILPMVMFMLQTGSTNNIIGKWKSVEETNGFHFILEFTESGSHSLTMVAESSGTYKILGNQIQFDSSKMGREVNEFRIENNLFFLTTPKGQEKLTRLGKALADAPLVGRWEQKVTSEDGQRYSITMEFTKNGRFKSMLIFEPKSGSYKIAGDSLTTTADNQSSTVRFRIEKGLLIEYEGTGKHKFRKIE